MKGVQGPIRVGRSRTGLGPFAIAVIENGSLHHRRHRPEDHQRRGHNPASGSIRVRRQQSLDHRWATTWDHGEFHQPRVPPERRGSEGERQDQDCADKARFTEIDWNAHPERAWKRRMMRSVISTNVRNVSKDGRDLDHCCPNPRRSS